MSYFAAIIIVVLSACAAGLAALIVDRFIAVERRRKHHEVGFQVFSILGLMFSVVLAFVLIEVWSQYNAAKQAIVAECGALHGAAMIANAMPNHEGRPINRNLSAYVNEVITAEWPAMADQRRSIEAQNGLRTAIDTAARLPVTSASDLASRTQILQLLSDAHAARELRTFQLDLGLPMVMWTVLIFMSVLLTGFIAFAGAERPANVTFTAIFAVCVVMVLVLVRLLDYPFEGALALGSGDFAKLGGQIADLLAMA